MALCWAASIARCCLLLRFCASNCATVCASCKAIGKALSIAACTIACPAIELAANPRCAIIAVAWRIAPDAQGGGVSPSNCVIKLVSCPCTVAAEEGAPVAASIPSRNCADCSALAAPDTSSPCCKALFAGDTICCPVP